MYCVVSLVYNLLCLFPLQIMFLFLNIMCGPNLSLPKVNLVQQYIEHGLTVATKEEEILFYQLGWWCKLPKEFLKLTFQKLAFCQSFRNSTVANLLYEIAPFI